MDIKIRAAQQINSELYKEMLNDIKVIDSERIINEGTIDYQCDYYTIYYHKGSKCVGLHHIVHCSCYGTEEDEPITFGENESMLIVDTIEDFYKKCINNTLEYNGDHHTEVKESYINWFEENFYNETERYQLILNRKQEKIQKEQEKIEQEQEAKIN